MKSIATLFVTLLLLSPSTYAVENPKVIMETNMGSVTFELYADKAPLSVKNFLAYVDDGSYEGTIFHRVIKKFMNQGGGFTSDFKKKPTKAPVQNEAVNGLKNVRGTIAMARTNVPHSATNQFFINTADNTFLNHTGKNVRGWGYAVFGKVIKGMDVMDKIEQVRTQTLPTGMRDVPIDTVLINKMSVVEQENKK